MSKNPATRTVLDRVNNIQGRLLDMSAIADTVAEFADSFAEDEQFAIIYNGVKAMARKAAGELTALSNEVQGLYDDVRAGAR